MHLWYLAHPVRGDEQFTTAENLAHTIKITRLLFDARVVIFAPWHLHCLALDDNNPVERELGIAADHLLIRHFHGIICVGHKMSNGMFEEVLEISGYTNRILNAVGVPDRRLAEYVTFIMKALDDSDKIRRAGRT